MKAFAVFYAAPGKSGLREIVLAEDEQQLSKALSEKVPDYKLDGERTGSSRIISSKEIPLSSVKLKDLSITEFLKIKNL